ncbi:MAG TPA: DUF1475 family protein [Thermoanaerobaculia bacterium]|nr:DUF1475 family protein [Thermoanaerobaculia bacterium]
MIVTLRILFSAILAVMIGSTIWASMQLSIFDGGGDVIRNPWGLMTLLDAYFGFLTFYVWVAYKERTMLSRVLWLIAILGLGNIAMAAYMLLELSRLPRDAGPKDLLLRRGQA